jgi:hypothetical protein
MVKQASNVRKRLRRFLTDDPGRFAGGSAVSEPLGLLAVERERLAVLRSPQHDGVLSRPARQPRARAGVLALDRERHVLGYPCWCDQRAIPYRGQPHDLSPGIELDRVDASRGRGARVRPRVTSAGPPCRRPGNLAGGCTGSTGHPERDRDSRSNQQAKLPAAAPQPGPAGRR